MSEERRREQRIAVRRTGRVVVGGLARKLSVIDVARGGFAGLAEEPVTAGAHVLAELPLASGEAPARVSGIVTWSLGRVFGARFEWLEPEAAAALGVFLSRHEQADARRLVAFRRGEAA